MIATGLRRCELLGLRWSDFEPDAAKAVVPDLAREGVEFTSLSAVEMGAACSAFQDGVAAGDVVHAGQPELDAAIATPEPGWSAAEQGN